MKVRQIKLIAAAVVVIVIALMTAFLAYKYSPSKEVMELAEYFSTDNDEMAIVLQDTISDEKGYYSDGVPYVRYSLVKELFNKRFYWDSNEKIMIYTTPDSQIKIQPDTNEYTVNKGSTKADYVIVKLIDGTPYIAMPFVKDYSAIDYHTYELPNRIVIRYKWGESELVSTVRKATKLRYEASIKSPILADLSPEDEVMYVDTAEKIEGGFAKVITEDGIIGYVKEKKLRESSYRVLDTEFTAPEYAHIHKNYDICMVWHQTLNSASNAELLNLLNSTKGVNTVSPTWFSVKDNNGGVSSIADETYVQRAHNAGVEVWGLCDDFNKSVDIGQVLSHTSVREKLENKLISLAIEYNLDGLNIDFENIKAECGEHFIQFVRELSIRCRSNGIVLSVNNYVPVEYRKYYDYEEQGTVADYVVIMAYDEHYAGSEEAGSVSSLGFVKDAVKNITDKVPADQVIMALPFYTRLWNITVAKDGTEKTESSAYGMSGAETVLSDRNVKPSWDSEKGQYYAEYTENKATYKIWLEEENSIEEKLKALTEGNIHNVSFWRLGLEKTEIWNVVSNYINAN